MVVRTPAKLRATLGGKAPPAGLTAPLQALWWAAGGDWNRAHRLVQNDASAQAAWVHAYLHRIEGDLSNARYWYARAGKPPSSDPLDAEWEGIAATLLG
jgi:hypothetical protein